MKTSKKILLIVAGIFGGLLIVSLISFRKETMAVVSDIQARSPFAPVAVEGFDQVDFSGQMERENQVWPGAAGAPSNRTCGGLESCVGKCRRHSLSEDC